MFVQRRRWWTNVERTLIQRLLVSAGYRVYLWDRLTIQPLQANTHTAGQSHVASVVSMLAHCLPTFGQRCCIRPTINDKCISQQTRDVDPMLF